MSNMASKAAQIGKRMYYFKRPNRWSQGLGAELPEEYRKFYKEWKLTQPTPVHFIPEKGKYKFDERLRTVIPIQNVPLPLKYPKEINEGIWGGEAVVQGFQKKNFRRRRIPHFWVPVLQKNVIYSEILDKYMRMVVTDRTMDLIHEHYGFDHYILKTPACDLRSLLALKLKKMMLLALMDKTLYPDDPVKKEEVYNQYKGYLEGYTRQYLEWYGMSFGEACKKIARSKMEEHMKNEVPLKIQFRKNLFEQLKAEQKEIEEENRSKSWFQRINPFASDANPVPQNN